MSTTALYTTEAISTGDGRNGHVRTPDGVLDADLTVPKEMGGPGGEKTNPEQLFAAGYAACFHNGLRLIAAGQKTPVSGSTVTADVSLLAIDDGRFTLAVGSPRTCPAWTRPRPTSSCRTRTGSARTRTPLAATSR